MWTEESSTDFSLTQSNAAKIGFLSSKEQQINSPENLKISIVIPSDRAEDTRGVNKNSGPA
jgi:hypothetical protein